MIPIPVIIHMFKIDIRYHGIRRIEIKKRAKALPTNQRADLARELIKSLEERTEKNVSDEWDKEIKRRVDEIKSGTAKGRPAIDIHTEIQAKYS